MPNFMLLLRLLGVDRLAGPAVATLLPLAVGVAAMLRLTRWESRIAVALVAGLLAAPHVYLQDTLLLLPAFGLAHVEAPRMRAILAIALVPIVPLILLKGLPLSALLPALMLASLVAAIVAPRPPGPATSPAPAS